MIEEPFTDAERQLLLVLVSQAMVRIRDDAFMQHVVEECENIIRKLSGTDTVLVAQRTYPSQHRVVEFRSDHEHHT